MADRFQKAFLLQSLRFFASVSPRRFLCSCDKKEKAHEKDYSVSTMLVSMSTASLIESAGIPNTIPKTVEMSEMIEATMTNTIFLFLLSIGSLRSLYFLPPRRFACPNAHNIQPRCSALQNIMSLV